MQNKKYRCHETMLALLSDADFRYIVTSPDKAGTAYKII